MRNGPVISKIPNEGFHSVQFIKVHKMQLYGLNRGCCPSRRKSQKRAQGANKGPFVILGINIPERGVDATEAPQMALAGLVPQKRGQNSAVAAHFRGSRKTAAKRPRFHAEHCKKCNMGCVESGPPLGHRRCFPLRNFRETAEKTRWPLAKRQKVGIIIDVFSKHGSFPLVAPKKSGVK